MPATGTSSSIVLAGATLPSPQDVKRQASRIYDALDARGYGVIKRQTVAEALPDNRYLPPEVDAKQLIEALNLDTEGTISKSLFVKGVVQHFRQLAKATTTSDAPKATPDTIKQVQEAAKEERQKKYCCIRGSSMLNSLSGTEAFKMSIVRVNSAKRLRNIFEQIDTDNDGKFNALDFRAFLHKSSTRLEKMTQGLFNNMDKAGKGFLVLKDFVRMMYPSANESNVRQLMSMGRDHKTTYVVKMTPERIREMKATFKECDIDNSGDVSRAEFIDGIQNAGYTAEQAEIMFASVDKDGNGVIVEDEFIQWCQEELQRAADAAVEENEHFMSDSESDSDVDELVSKHAVMGAADEAAFAKRLGIDARQLSLGLYT